MDAPLEADVTVHLRASGCSLLLTVADAALPSVPHWGRDLGELDAEQVDSVLALTREQVGPNSLDEPVRVSIVPEHSRGWTGRPGLRGSRAGVAWSSRFEVSTVRVGPEPVTGFVQAGPAEVTVDATDHEAALELRLVVEMLPSGLVRCRATVTNRGEEYAVDDLVLSLPVPARATEVLDMTGRWGMERLVQRHPFTVGSHVREGRKGRTGADAATLLHALVPGVDFGQGEAWALHTAWSGNHTHYAERTSAGHRRLGGGELLLSGEVRLGRDAAYASPWLYAAWGDGLDALARRFHDHLRSRPGHPAPDRPVTLNVWEAVYFDHDLDRLRELARRAAAVGVERFVLDDGWFGGRRSDRAGLGDWVVSREVWPEGLHPLVHTVRELGMSFGLWFEPEMVNPDSEVARAHPEWIMAARSTWPPQARSQQVLNLSIPQAFDHVLGQMLAILDEYDISYLKWDHNRDLIDAGTQGDDGRPAVHEQTLAAYRMIDRIRQSHPGLEIESCSSGGSRVDLGVLERTDRVWVSDTIDPLERQRLLRWTGQLLPPELMGSHIGSPRSHTTGRSSSLSFRAGTSVFGHLGVEWDLTEASPTELEELAAWIAFYRAHRRLLLGGDMVRGPDPDEATWLHGVVAPDRREAVFAVVAMAWAPESPGPPLRLRGLDPDLTYEVRPVHVGATPFGLVRPPWWRGARFGSSAVRAPGSVLESVGLQSPRLGPATTVLFHLLAED